MGTVEIGVDPVLLRAGGMSVGWFGLLAALGAVAGWWLAVRRRGVVPVGMDDLTGAALWGAVLALVVARLAHVVARFDFYALHPLAIPALGDGGLALDGGLAGAVLGGAVAARRRRLHFWRLADLAAPSIAVGLAVGRVGSLLNGDAWGRPAGAAWGLVYTNPDALLPRLLLGVPTYPVAAAEIVLFAALGAILWAVGRRQPPAGVSWLAFLAATVVGRAALSPFRGDAAAAGPPLFGAALLGLCAVAWAWGRRRTGSGAGG